MKKIFKNIWFWVAVGLFSLIIARVVHVQKNLNKINADSKKPITLKMRLRNFFTMPIGGYKEEKKEAPEVKNLGKPVEFMTM